MGRVLTRGVGKRRGTGPQARRVSVRQDWQPSRSAGAEGVFALYSYGIVGDGGRKCVEPIAARATGDAEECERMQARLLNFLRDSPLG
jgi:hypothetical protein